MSICVCVRARACVPCGKFRGGHFDDIARRCLVHPNHTRARALACRTPISTPHYDGGHARVQQQQPYTPQHDSRAPYDTYEPSPPPPAVATAKHQVYNTYEPSPPASKSQLVTSLTVFKMAPKSGFEMCFAPNQNAFRIQHLYIKKVVKVTLVSMMLAMSGQRQVDARVHRRAVQRATKPTGAARRNGLAVVD